MKKRGQVTLFVIVGIVLLFIVAFALYLNQLAAQSDLDKQIDASIQEFIQLNSINHFVSSCLDSVTSQGLLLLGEQGGVIYEFQNGTWSNPDVAHEGETHLPYNYSIITYAGTPLYRTPDVFYGLHNNLYCSLYEPPVPIVLTDPSTSRYPIWGEYLDNFVRRYEIPSFQGGCYQLAGKSYQSGFLGQNRLLPLCSYNGSNAQSETSPCLPLQFDNPGEPYSLQRQLEDYVEKELPRCTNFTVFEQTGMRIVPNFNNVTVEIYLLQPRGIRAKAYYPFEVFVQGSDSVVELVDFQTKVDSNIRIMYLYLQELTTLLTRDPFFNLTQDWNNTAVIPSYRGMFQLKIQEQACTTCRPLEQLDDIYSIIDTSTIIKGRRFVYNFASRQRRPVLDYIHDLAQDYVIDPGPTSVEFDKQFFSNSTMQLAPRAADINQDSITYEYQGWMQNYSQFLDWDCCEDPTTGPCTLEHHIQCMGPQNSIDEEETWMGSQEFLLTQQNASIEANRSFIGLHNVTIIATDEHGQRDFQIVQLLIFDLPLAVLGFTNHYDDVYDGLASIEDAYTLDASESIASGFIEGDITRAQFVDEIEGIDETMDEELNGDLLLALHLPSGDHLVNPPTTPILDPQTGYSPSNIGDGRFTREVLAGQISMQHPISLTVFQEIPGGELASPTITREITVSQCLPHGYEAPLSPAPFSPLTHFGDNPIPYPYSGEGTFFSAPHVCCEPTGIIGDPDNITSSGQYNYGSDCYVRNFYLANPDSTQPYPELSQALQEDANGYLSPYYTPGDYGGAYPDTTTDLFGIENDIFEINFAQQCSGNRGNVCSGYIQASVGEIIECADLDGGSGEFARCQGPGYVDGDGVEHEVPTTPSFTLPEDVTPQCINYELGQSYEQSRGYISPHYLGGGDPDDLMDLINDGFCGEGQWRRVSGNQLTQGYPTPFLCGPMCDGEGACTVPDSVFDARNCACETSNDCDGYGLEDFYNYDEEEILQCGTNSLGLDYACDTGCIPQVVTNDNARQACACAIRAGGDTADPVLPEEYDYFYDHRTEWGEPDSYDRYGYCCTGNNAIYESGGDLSGVASSRYNSVCYQGSIVPDGQRMGNTGLLSCDGKILFCDTSSGCDSNPGNAQFVHACASTADTTPLCGGRRFRCTTNPTNRWQQI